MAEIKHPGRKQAKVINRHFSEEQIQITQTYMKINQVPATLSFQENQSRVILVTYFTPLILTKITKRMITPIAGEKYRKKHFQILMVEICIIAGSCGNQLC